MKKKSWAVLMRSRMAIPTRQLLRSDPLALPQDTSRASEIDDGSINTNAPRVSLKDVKEWMQASISISAEKTELVDVNLENFSQGYLGLSLEGRRVLLLDLSRDYDVNRTRVRELMRKYLSVELPHDTQNEAPGEQQAGLVEDGGMLAMYYRMERNLRDSFKPLYASFFERLNAHPGGLKLLTSIRADLLSVPPKENVPSLHALEAYLKEKLITWLSPATLELQQITWDDSASLLEKIVTYEAVHPIRNLLDLKRRLSKGRRCFGYFHPAIPGEPLIFIEVALLKDVASSIQEVLWDSPPAPEVEAKCALFYSISATQPGLSGINLGKFLIKRVVYLLRRDMPHITIFATLSPIPGYIQWLISKLASQLKLAQSESKDIKHISEKACGSNFKEDILLPEEEEMILSGYMNWLNSNTASEIEHTEGRENMSGKSGIEIMYEILTSKNWNGSVCLSEALKPSLLRLCARYLLQEKKRGRALDAVANFHLQNGSMIERINWMADQSIKGIEQSGGIMVNYVYRLDKIDEYAQAYLNTGHVHASCSLHQYLQRSKDENNAAS
ncbi:malonyl-CoA decarboxylase, mitochondrial-like isoform X1 [Zingiber officinale]|uniref:malonyl-CoA decarboxylase, mitochondrial-like isoform X1 n=1 Tax=Zingiber officinale TaxID=94328 RepID=UPI001C4C2623|nr:malonyl-CoA decarboxylase, mitochondrial-like isoform X1 [Zingiber officinale]